MRTASRDTIVSICLLVFCGFLIRAGFQIRDPQFGELSPAAWPQAVSWVLTVFCLIYFLQSMLADRRRQPQPQPADSPDAESFSLLAWLCSYANPIFCFALYFLFLATLPWLGTLIGGILLVFLLLSVLGGVQPRQIGWHLLIAVVSVGSMWMLFTHGLRVMLPRGLLIPGI